MGLHEADPIPLRCKIGLHTWKVVNKVRYKDTPEGKIHHILKCEDCGDFNSRTVNI